MEINIRFTYFTFFSVLCLLCQNCSSQEQPCSRLKENNGTISESSSSYNRQLCWIIEVPEDSFVRIDIKSINFYYHKCFYNYLLISHDEMKGDHAYKYCGEEAHPKPITAFSDVTIRYHFRKEGNDRATFELQYFRESTICAQKDHFRCSPTHCIYQYQVCNGVKDCQNGADEKDCDGYIASIKGMDVSRDNLISWMKKQRSHYSGWGKNTHRAITALYLAQTDSFRGDSLEDEIIVKQLELQTSIALLRNVSDPMSVNELAMFVNALSATCHNPRSFYGYDLVQILGERASRMGWNSSRTSAFLTLCSLNWRTFGSYQYSLMRLLDRPSKYLFHPDVQAMAIMALSCAKNKHQAFENSPDDERLYNSTIEKLISGQLSDGSFGNIYTTALVTQALISSGQESNIKWNKTATAQYLMRSLNSSSIDFLSAYLTLPIFNGKTLVDLADVDCSNSTRKPGGDKDVTDVTNKLGGKMKIKYSLIIGDQKDVVQTLILRVRENISAYDVMRVAQITDPKFKFRHRVIAGQMYVYEIASMINDPEAGTFWLLYTEETRSNGTQHFLHHTDSPDKLILKDNGHLIMWYKTAQVVDASPRVES